MLVVTSAIGLYYYLRVILIMARTPETPELALPAAGSGAASANLLLAALALGILWIGVYPAPVIELIRRTAAAVLPF